MSHWALRKIAVTELLSHDHGWFCLNLNEMLKGEP